MTKMVCHFLPVMMLLMGSTWSGQAQEVWVPQNSGTTSTLYRVQFLNADLGYAVGDGGTVLKTTDGGAYWSQVSIPSSHPVRDLSFVNDLLGWVATGDPNSSTNSGSVWQTTNGGNTWAQQTLGTTNARLGISFVSTTHGWACGANNGPWDIRATTNGGVSWSLQSGSGFGWTYDIDCISTTTGWTVGVVYFPTSSGFILKTTNGGSTWSQLNIGTVPFLYGVQFVDPNYGYAVGDGGTVLATTNGGTNWTSQTSGTTANLSDVAFVSASLGWVCGANGTILKTTNGGGNWISQTSGTSAALNGIYFLNSTAGWAVGEAGTILTTATIPLVDLTLIPTGTPTISASGGGTFNYTGILTNNSGATLPFQYWCKISQGTTEVTVFGPISRIAPVPPPPINRSLDQTIAGGIGLVPGTATYTGYVGSSPTVWASNSFPVTVVADYHGGPFYDKNWLTGWEDEPVVLNATAPTSFELKGNFPNPFNAATQIHFVLPQAGQVSLKVYNTSGRLVQTLVDGYRQAGWHEVAWDASGVATGLYVCRLQAGEFTEAAKMMLVK